MGWGDGGVKYFNSLSEFAKVDKLYLGVHFAMDGY